MKKADPIEQKVETLLAKLTLKEKVSLLSGKDIWNTVPIERLGIPSIVMTDGPYGVRASNPDSGRIIGPATSFPTGISMAASWNPDLVERVGQALGEETRGMGCDILLGPCVNIMRDPRGGRNFEAFSEDPYLSGRMAVAYIIGVQSRGVGTSLKHYAVNNYEIERNRASSNVDERTLREIYLAQFEVAVKESQPWTVMCSYNRINGVYAGEHNYLLNQILKDEWGFKGAVISDWGATHTAFDSVAHGLDLEMPGPAKYLQLLEDAVRNWQIDIKAVDKAVRRVLRTILLSGRMGGKVSKGSVNTPAHQSLARQLAEEAITLLKNDGGILPLNKGKTKSLAVIGPNAAEAVVAGGGSSRTRPPYRVSPLEGLRKVLGDKVAYERGCDNYDKPFEVPQAWMTGPDGKPGLRGKLFVSPDFSGEPLFVQDGFRADFWWHTAWSSLEAASSARWETKLTVPEDGEYLFALGHTSLTRLYLDDKLILESRAPETGANTLFGASASASVVKKLKGGQTYALRIDHVRYPNVDVLQYGLGLGLTFAAGQDPRLQRAVELAKRCDVALVFAGMPESYEAEGSDRDHMDLVGKQNELIDAVASANPKTVVVLNTGSPVSMPWLDKVAAVVEMYFPGQENGNAVAKVLLGEVNPSGKLTATFPKRLEDSPTFINASYPDCREVNYGEGIFVGYRYYDEKDVTPLFPFGHGLSYTAFAYSGLKVAKKVKASEPIKVTLKVKNAGKVAGKEVVQLYVSDPQSALPRPPKELKGFAKVDLKPGQSKMVSFTLDERSLAYYDPVKKGWVAEPGKFEVLAGSSSRDIRLKAKFTLE
ncbi:MAG: glycoside hydrolase family 3 C-terminal domain-containing protein [Chloroflexota bacterium]